MPLPTSGFSRAPLSSATREGFGVSRLAQLLIYESTGARTQTIFPASRPVHPAKLHYNLLFQPNRAPWGRHTVQLFLVPGQRGATLQHGAGAPGRVGQRHLPRFGWPCRGYVHSCCIGACSVPCCCAVGGVRSGWCCAFITPRVATAVQVLACATTRRKLAPAFSWLEIGTTWTGTTMARATASPWWTSEVAQAGRGGGCRRRWGEDEWAAARTNPGIASSQNKSECFASVIPLKFIDFSHIHNGVLTIAELRSST